MYDALMLAAIIDELNDTLLDGKVQRVLLLDQLSVGIEVYANGARHQLLLSANASDPRLHLVSREAKLTGDPNKVTPLLLLLRKWVRGARLVRIYQEAPLERVACLRFAKFIPYGVPESSPDDTSETILDDDETALDGELVETTIVVEIMGRHSNLILVGSDGAIMESAKRVPARLSRVRQILPKLPYTPAPPQEKADPRTLTADDLTALLTANPTGQLHQILVSTLRGISPQIAREIAFRATGSIRTKAEAAFEQRPALLRAIGEIVAPLRTGAWVPTLYLRPADELNHLAITPVAFSPVPLFYLREMQEERFNSPSALVERFFGATARVQAHGQRKDALAAVIQGERERLAGRERSLAIEAQRAEEAERWRQWGEAIYAYAWSLAPGQQTLVADDLTVPLDPALTPSENAQEYFERYRKAQSAAANIPALLEETRQGIAYLDQLLILLQLAEQFDQIAALDREWQQWQQRRQRQPDNAAPPKHQQRGKKGQQKPPRGAGAGKPQTLRTRGGHQIFIGHTSAQNDAVTFDIAGPDDSWLHSRGVPGSHVIIKWASNQQDEQVIQAAAELAAYYSGGREAGRVEVDHAARRDVRKIRGAGPGMVTYRNEYTVRVSPKSEAELRQRGILE